MSSLFTFIFALVRKHQTTVLTLCLKLREPLFDFGEAEVLFEEGVAVDSRNGKYELLLGDTDKR